MNRQEIVTKIQNKINKFYKNNVCTENERQLLNEIFDEVEILRQPITLAEFLGWEEDVIYTDGTAYYKIQNNSIFHKTKGKIKQVWTLSGYNDYLNFYNKFRELEKVEEKRYNLILQKGYRELFDLQDCEKYLTIDTTDGTVFNSKYSTNNSKYQAQFTLEEIEEIKKIYDIDLCIYDIMGVQE